MFIDANLITVLMEKYEESVRNGQIFIHPNTVIRDLEGLIDAEAARLEKMADDFEAEEYGRLELEEAALQKEARVDFNWPHGV
jgi:hypothetical protein|tara:strand:+ start:124 stop:372 length:249 start_codon:yes stop_codon:yes gene_type:complete